MSHPRKLDSFSEMSSTYYDDDHSTSNPAVISDVMCLSTFLTITPSGNPNNEHRFERIGNGSWFLNAYLDNFFTCLGSFYTTEDYDLSQFTRATTPEELEHYFRGFEGGNGIVEVDVSSPLIHIPPIFMNSPSNYFEITDSPKVLSKYSGLRLIPEIEHPKAHTYGKGLVAMVSKTSSIFRSLHGTPMTIP